MKLSILAALTAACFVAAVAGCGGAKSANALASKNNALFSSADPAVKACWDAAQDALKTNGYAAAILSLSEITKGTNSTLANPEQIKAAGETVTAVSDQMYAAANKGDAQAQAALDELKKTMGR